MSRSEWGAAPPAYEPAPISVPTPELVLHHFATDGWHGPAGMRQCQAFHMAPTWEGGRGFNDIAYSFCVDNRDGTIYEGRGFGIQGAHTKGHNSTAHAVCAMMNSEVTQPTKALLAGLADLVNYGRRQGKWPDVFTHYHKMLGQTACPGRHLIEAFPAINALIRHDEMAEPKETEMLETFTIEGEDGTYATWNWVEYNHVPRELIAHVNASRTGGPHVLTRAQVDAMTLRGRTYSTTYGKPSLDERLLEGGSGGGATPQQVENRVRKVFGDAAQG